MEKRTERQRTTKNKKLIDVENNKVREQAGFCIDNTYPKKIKEIGKKLSMNMWEVVELALENLFDKYSDNLEVSITKSAKEKLLDAISYTKDLYGENKYLRKIIEEVEKTTGYKFSIDKEEEKDEDTEGIK